MLAMVLENKNYLFPNSKGNHSRRSILPVTYFLSHMLSQPVYAQYSHTYLGNLPRHTKLDKGNYVLLNV